MWAWLLPHYALAHHRVHRDRAAALATLEPLGRSIETLALGFLPEMADGDAPHAARGRWASAAATGEILRAGMRQEFRAGRRPRSCSPLCVRPRSWA